MSELRIIRESLGITQIEAAKILGISRRTYQKYEALDYEDPKLKYYIYKLNEFSLIDEENGILEEDIKIKTGGVFSKYNINFCYLFGSYAKNKATKTSDIDLIIDSDITWLDFFGLVEELRQTLHKRIDLLKINQLENNLELLREILKDGIKIYG